VEYRFIYKDEYKYNIQIKLYPDGKWITEQDVSFFFVIDGPGFKPEIASSLKNAIKSANLQADIYFNIYFDDYLFNAYTEIYRVDFKNKNNKIMFSWDTKDRYINFASGRKKFLQLYMKEYNLNF